MSSTATAKGGSKSKGAGQTSTYRAVPHTAALAAAQALEERGPLQDIGELVERFSRLCPGGSDDLDPMRVFEFASGREVARPGGVEPEPGTSSIVVEHRPPMENVVHLVRVIASSSSGSGYEVAAVANEALATAMMSRGFVRCDKFSFISSISDGQVADGDGSGSLSEAALAGGGGSSSSGGSGSGGGSGGSGGGGVDGGTPNITIPHTLPDIKTGTKKRPEPTAAAQIVAMMEVRRRSRMPFFVVYGACVWWCIRRCDWPHHLPLFTLRRAPWLSMG
jgi:hypothetical protein